MIKPTRRSLLAGFGAGAASLAAPSILRAQPRELVIIGYGGDLDGPAIARGDILKSRHPGLEVRIVGGLSAEAIAQIRAARGASPYDFSQMEPPAILNGLDDGVIEPLNTGLIPSFGTVEEQLLPSAYGVGVPIVYNVIGFAYNMEMIPNPPESWEDLWKPEYAGMVGMARPQSNLGLACVSMASRVFGRPDTDYEFGLDKWKELDPIVGRTPVLLTQMLERGEIGICPLWHSNAALAASRGLPFGFVKPLPGPLVLPSSVVGFINSASMDLVHEYVEIGLQPEMQMMAAAPPYYFGPTIKGVLPPPEAAAYLPSTPEEIASVQSVDWTEIAPLRGDIVDAFDRLFAI